MYTYIWYLIQQIIQIWKENMYNQQFQKPQNNSWHNQFHRFANSYYNRKTNEQLEELIKNQQKQNAMLIQFDQLNNQLETLKNKITEGAQSEKQRIQISSLFQELFVQQKKYVYEKLEQEDKIKKYEQYFKHKRTQIVYIDNQIKKFEGMVVDVAQFEKQQKIQTSLKEKDQHLEMQILRSDPLTFRQQQNQSLFYLAQQLEEYTKIRNKMQNEYQNLHLRQTIERSSLALDVGKIEELERQHKEKQGKLISLQRHLQQIKQRIQAMLREKKSLRKRGKDISVNNQIKEVELEKKNLEDQLTKINFEIERIEKSVQNGHTKQKLEQLQKELKLLEQEQTQIYKKAKKTTNREEELQNLRQEYEKGKKYRKKKIQKFEKRLKEMETQVEESKKETCQLIINREKLTGELKMLEQQLQRLNKQMQQIQVSCSSIPAAVVNESQGQNSQKKIVAEPDRMETVKVQEKSEAKSTESGAVYIAGFIILISLCLIAYYI